MNNYKLPWRVEEGRLLDVDGEALVDQADSYELGYVVDCVNSLAALLREASECINPKFPESQKMLQKIFNQLR